jgi:hypothetical protein
MRRGYPVVWAFGVALALLTTGCPADEQALDPPGGPPVDLSPDPRIEEAPAFPTPAGQVPVGLQPDTAPREQVDLDTIPGGQVEAGRPAATPARPGAPTGLPQQPAQPEGQIAPPRP